VQENQHSILSIRPPTRVVSCSKGSAPCASESYVEYSQQFLTPGQHSCNKQLCVAKSWYLCLVSPATRAFHHHTHHVPKSAQILKRNRNSKHFSVKMKSLSGVVNTITGDNCKCVDKRRGGQGHGSRSLPILHQAVTW